MSFGKRRDIRHFANLPLSLQVDLVRLVGLVGLWMIHVDLRGGKRHFNQKLQILKDKIAKNIHKFEQYPLIHGLLKAVQHTPLPAPLPSDQVCHHARLVLDATSERCGPRDIGALRLVLLDIAEAILQSKPPVSGPSIDPFFAHKIPFSEKMRHWVRKIGRINDFQNQPDHLSPTEQMAMQALVLALGAQDLWGRVEYSHPSPMALMGEPH